MKIDIFPIKIGTLRFCCPNGDGQRLADAKKSPEDYVWTLQVVKIPKPVPDCNLFYNLFWQEFWTLIAQDWAEQQKKELYYDPWPECPLNGCNECEDTHCPQRGSSMAQDEECDYTGDECIDGACRRNGCVGCEIIAPPSKADLQEVS